MSTDTLGPSGLLGAPTTTLRPPSGPGTVVSGTLNFGTTGAPSGAPTGLTADQSSAKGILDAFFGQMGLTSLSDWAWQKFLAGDSLNQIFQETKGTKEYAARFPAMAELDKRGEGITEAQYINYESSIHQLVHAAGLTPGMYDDPAQIAKMLTNSVSVSEANQRIQAASVAAFTAPQSTRDAWKNLFGMNEGDIISGYLDTDKALPLIQRQAAAAAVAGAGYDQGISTSKDMALHLADQGISYQQALQGFGQVSSQTGLEAGFGETANQDELTGAAFGDAGAVQQVGRVLKGRLAVNSGGGGAVTGQGGIVGLGVNRA